MRHKYLHSLKARLLGIVGVFALTAALLSACGSAGASTGTVATAMGSSSVRCCRTSSQLALYSTMRNLWAQHMEWTYATVTAFAANSPGLTATLDRLLQNQTDLGNAVKPYYGDAAGNELSKLLHAHIEGYVPLLKDAKAGNQAKASQDFSAILANGVQIGKFLEQANPKYWPAPEIEQMMTTHNQQTLKYATDQLEGDYAVSITDYGTAEAHMYQMGDMLTTGIIAQFPGRFRGASSHEIHG